MQDIVGVFNQRGIPHEQPHRLRQGFARRLQGLRRRLRRRPESGLPKELVDLVYLRVSQINGCAFCIDMHSRDLLKSGLAVDKLVLVPVWHDAGACSAPASAPPWPGRKP
jgi:AhpD family alkylhydroperoxidase